MKEEAGEEARPYVPDWPQVTIESSQSMAYEKLEWLRNYLPPNVLECNKELAAGSVIGLGVQLALLVRILCIKDER